MDSPFGFNYAEDIDNGILVPNKKKPDKCTITFTFKSRYGAVVEKCDIREYGWDNDTTTTLEL